METLSSERPSAGYNCTQQEHYSAAKIGWKSFMENLTPFSNFSTKYTAVYGTTMKAAVQSAKVLPDEFVRTDEHKSVRIELVSLANICMITWQQLASFIRDGFAEELYDSKISAAGHEYYRGAGQHDWESVSGLMEDGKAFIAANTTDLTTGGMPAGFDVTFDGVKTAFDDKYEEFTDMEQDMQEGTDEKINANNTVYKNLIHMFEDGQKIFRNNPSIKDRFVFDKVIALISSGGAAGISDEGLVNGGQVGSIYTESTPEYVAGVTMRLRNTTPIGSSASDIVILGFYPANSEGEGYPGGSNPQLSNGQETEITIPVADFKPFYNVHNMSGQAGSWEVTIL